MAQPDEPSWPVGGLQPPTPRDETGSTHPRGEAPRRKARAHDSHTLSAVRSEEGQARLDANLPFLRFPKKRTIRRGEDCTHLHASEWIPSMQEFPSKHSTVRALNSNLSQLHLGVCPRGSATTPSVPVSTPVTWEQYWTASPGLF